MVSIDIHNIESITSKIVKLEGNYGPFHCRTISIYDDHGVKTDINLYADERLPLQEQMDQDKP